MREVGVEVEFREEEVWKDSEKMEKEWAGCWAELKKGMQNGYTEKLKNDYKKEGMQSQVFAGQENESLVWLTTNIKLPIRHGTLLDGIKAMSQRGTGSSCVGTSSTE